MSDKHRASARWPALSLLGLIFGLRLLPTRAAKRIIAFTYVSFVTFVMGRTVLGRSDCKKHTTASSEKQLAAIQIEETTCLICQEPVGTRNPEGVTERWSMLPCGHTFGSHCIKTYLAVAADNQPLCPICRHIAYHDPCGHPVLPFMLNSNGTHPDLVTDASGKLRPPTAEEELTTAPCAYCQRPEEVNLPHGDKQAGSVTKFKKPFYWLRDLVPFARRRRAPSQTDSSESSDAENDRGLTRQEARARRRTPVNQGTWQGPWMDVQTRDLGWEQWWNNQAPRVK